ncbi:MAG: GIY-YIG nuclease family protein [Candidatus Paceibacterota bacterium]|jgi:putative endonuclease
MFHYVYILESKQDGELYIGCTNDLKKRIKEHNNGLVFSTKIKKPYRIIHYEAFLNKKDAFLREKWLKTGWGRNQIKKNLENYLADMNPPKLSK